MVFFFVVQACFCTTAVGRSVPWTCAFETLPYHSPVRCFQDWLAITCPNWHRRGGFCDYSLVWYALFRLRTLSRASKIFELWLVSLRPSKKFWNLHSYKLSFNWTRSAVIACLKWFLHSDIYFPNLFHGIKSLNATNSF